MKNVIRYFVRFPILGNSILFAIFLFGYVGFTSLTTTFFPPIPSKIIMITASYPGASPEEIEEGIVLKIEDNLKGVTGVDRVTSVSRENFASITVEKITGYDINVVLQDVKNAVDQISSFPVGMERINIYKQEPMTFATDFALSGDVDLRTLKTYARRLERDLLAVDGISKVTLSGFPAEEIEIAFREKDLQAYGLSFSEVTAAVARANIKMTGGKIKGSAEELLIRASVKGYYADELADHVLRTTDNGTIVRLKDVADLSDRWSEDPNRVYYNGRPAVTVSLMNTNQEDLFFVANTTKQFIEEFNAKHDDVQAAIVRDGSDIIKERTDILTTNGLLGMILVLLFLSLSLNPRMAFWVALSIPIAFAGMFALGPAYGLTINVMSLLAMILVLGILVDDGIVIGENIYQHHEKGEKPIQAAVNGTIEVLPSVVASVLTTMVIFVTFFFLEGALGDRTRDLAFVVIATLMFSLVEATFILPSHIAHSRALRDATKKKSRLEQTSSRVLGVLRDRTYAPFLRFSIRNPLVIVAVAIALYMITIGAMKGGMIKSTFFPILEFNRVTITLEMPAGTPDAVTDSLLADMEQSLWDVDSLYRDTYDDPYLISAVTRNIGPGTHQGNLRVSILENQYRTWSSMEVSNRFREVIGTVPDAEKLQVGGGSRFGMPVSIALSSNNLRELRDAKERLKDELRQVEKLKDVVDDDPIGLKEVSITLKEKAFALGLTSAEVMSQVRSGFFGSEAQRLLRGIDEVRIWVRYTQQDRSTLGKLEAMRIRLADGREFPLSEIADFTIERGVMSINHIDAQRVVKVEADIANPKESVVEIINDIKAQIMPEIIEEYPDIRFDFEGQSRETAKTTKAMKKVFPSILILMFLIIVVTFRSFSQAFAVFLLIPFSLIGVAWGHFFRGYIMSILSLFGAIALIGIVVNDSLVLVNAMNRLLRNGKKFREALYEAGLSRFRPVLLTSLTTIAGLGPLIFETSRQAQFLSPMAISVAFGLLFGTLLTLLLLPAFLVIINRLKIYVVWLIRRNRPPDESVESAVRELKWCQDGECD